MGTVDEGLRMGAGGGSLPAHGCHIISGVVPRLSV